MLSLRLDDVLITMKALGTQTIDLGSYLTHFIPRLSDNNDVIGQHHGNDLRDSPSTRCSAVKCTLSSDVCTIKTTWPRTLFVIPETRGDTKDAFKKRKPPPVQLPLEFTIRSYSAVHGSELDKKNEITTIHPSDAPAKMVQYRLIGRALYNATKIKSHYTAEFVIGDSLYMYNDLENGGLFSNAGVASSLKKSGRHITLVAYHRVSDANVCYTVLLLLFSTNYAVDH